MAQFDATSMQYHVAVASIAPPHTGGYRTRTARRRPPSAVRVGKVFARRHVGRRQKRIEAITLVNVR